MELKRNSAIYFFLVIFFSGLLSNFFSILTNKAKIVRIFEYANIIRGKLMVTIKDSSKKVIEHYTLERSSTILRYEYSPYNPMQVAKVWSETYIDVENGKKAIATTATEDGSQDIYSPGNKILIGTSIFGLNSKTGRRSSTPDVFVSDLPSKIYDFNGEKLHRIGRHKNSL